MSEKTDRERLLALLKDFGITPELIDDEVRLSVGTGNVGGCACLFCFFDFTADGKFAGAGVWEE